MGRKKHEFDIEAFYCASCNRYFYIDTKDKRVGRHDTDLKCPYGCSGEVEFNGDFVVKGYQTAVRHTVLRKAIMRRSA